jgi:hypothetical protein
VNLQLDHFSDDTNQNLNQSLFGEAFWSVFKILNYFKINFLLQRNGDTV